VVRQLASDFQLQIAFAPSSFQSASPAFPKELEILMNTARDIANELYSALG
jgi:hypothetical protein